MAMSGFTFGFYDSLNHDRRYNALQMSSIFDGIISDGVYGGILEQFKVVPGDGLKVIVKPGRAWFNHTWSLNVKDQVLSIDAADPSLKRIDIVVLEVNSTKTGTNGRTNSLKIVKGNPSVSPVAQALVETEFIHQHLLAEIAVRAGATSISSTDISIAVGRHGSCPLVVGITEKNAINAADWFGKWEGDIISWFNHLKDQLSSNVAFNLQTQIDNCVKYTDPGAGDVGDISITVRNLETISNKDWIECKGQELSVIEYPKLYSLIGDDRRIEISANIMEKTIEGGNYSLFANGPVLPQSSVIQLDNGSYVSMTNSNGSNPIQVTKNCYADLAFFNSNFDFVEYIRIQFSVTYAILKGIIPDGNSVILLVYALNSAGSSTENISPPLYIYRYTPNTGNISYLGGIYNKNNRYRYGSLIGYFKYQSNIYISWYSADSWGSGESDSVYNIIRISSNGISHGAFVYKYDDGSGNQYSNATDAVCISDNIYVYLAASNKSSAALFTMSMTDLNSELDKSNTGGNWPDRVSIGNRSTRFVSINESNIIHKIMDGTKGVVHLGTDKDLIYGSKTMTLFYPNKPISESIIMNKVLSGIGGLNPHPIANTCFYEDNRNFYVITSSKVTVFDKISGNEVNIVNSDVDFGKSNSSTAVIGISYTPNRVFLFEKPYNNQLKIYVGTVSMTSSPTFTNLTITPTGENIGPAKCYIRGR